MYYCNNNISKVFEIIEDINSKRFTSHSNGAINFKIIKNNLYIENRKTNIEYYSEIDLYCDLHLYLSNNNLESKYKITYNNNINQIVISKV